MPETMPAAEIWGRMAALLARNLPTGFNADKMLDRWLPNPAAQFAYLNRYVKWARGRKRVTRQAIGKDNRTDLIWSLHAGSPTTADEKTYLELAELLDKDKDAPPARPMTMLEEEQFWRGVYAVKFEEAEGS
ncbi:hypothetical protein [Nonomuraea sp. SYSU D8015]|uniref:hypothetical protein n=1 Tax=Nonomuraea sp. SYSU D8015 TaxID=2593644 RepID=UPI0016602552|nr:hypothetical protein [Nonomuraea sp. SYSU D8015]